MDFLLCWIFAVRLYVMWWCRLVGRCQHFAGNCCFHLQSRGFWLLWRGRDEDFEFHAHYFLPVQIQIKCGWCMIITNIQTKFKFFYSLLCRLLKNKFYWKLVTVFRDGMCSVIDVQRDVQGDLCAEWLMCSVIDVHLLLIVCLIYSFPIKNVHIKKLIVCSRLVPLCLI